MKKKILVCGAGGYLGTHLVPSLIAKGYKVLALDRYFFGDVYRNVKNKHLEVVKGDVRSVDMHILKDVDSIINMAAISNDPASELKPKITQDINFKGAVSLAKKAHKAGVKKYIFASSCSVYGCSDSWLNEESLLAPVSEYARSKIAAEKALLPLNNSKFGVTVLRMGTLHGLCKDRMRFDLIINIMTLHAWKNNKIIIMGGGKQWRPLLHIDDAVRAYLLVLESDIRFVGGEIFNVGSNKENYQVTQVAYFFRNYFPSVIIEEAPDDPDKRNYRVAFDKILSRLGYTTQHGIGESIESIKHALEEGIVKDSLKTKTVQYYQYLLEADSELQRIKLNNRLF
jgi:nucleoside-diphosphate-sugar epimerase